MARVGWVMAAWLLGIMVAVPAGAQSLAPGTAFRDCDTCPEMVVIPPGSFLMGRNPSFEEGYTDELPQHRVTIPRPFALGKLEVTQAEWVALMGDNPSKFKGRSNPVEQVSWQDAQLFIARLNQKTGQSYRLPSEAEWEYAARAGSDAIYSFGDEEGQLGQYAWFQGNSGERTHPVGQLSPNRFGLHDVHGNVWEWVEDCGHDNYQGAPTNGSAWTTWDCKSRVLRSGSWFNHPDYARSAYRGRYTSGDRNSDFGFRVARTLTPLPFTSLPLA